MGLPFLFMYNVLSSVFNSLGKSRIPLYLLIFSSVLNIVLDYVLVRYDHLGVAGVAWATLIAQGLSALLSFLILLRQLREYRQAGSVVCFEGAELGRMARVALPSILQQSTVSIGMMLVQSVVNGFGSQVLAGYTAASRLESFCIVPMAATVSYTHLASSIKLSTHRPGLVYDFVTVCSSMNAIPKQYAPGVTLTMTEASTVEEIAEHPGVTAAQLCKKWNRTRGALSQLVKKLEQKGLSLIHI